MPRPDRKLTVDALIAAVGMIACGLFMRFVRAPGILVWSLVAFGAVTLLTIGYTLIRHPVADPEFSELDLEYALLRDGDRFRVDVTEADLTVTNLQTGGIERARWSDVTALRFVVSDNSWMGTSCHIVRVRRAPDIEIPTGCAGHDAFLHELRARFAGFDDEALLQGMKSSAGIWELWPRRPAGSSRTL